jgi:hypothetical protein
MCLRWLVQAIYNKTLFAFVLHSGAMVVDAGWMHLHLGMCVLNQTFILVNRLGPMCFHSYVYLLAVNKCSFIKQRNHAALHSPSSR